MNRVRARDLALVFGLALGVNLIALDHATLVDPWETHYGEVARRILADGDWVRLSWEDEGFRSKPALTPWLIAASLWLHDIARDGGFSGELAIHPWTAWAVRLPFAIFGALGVLSIFGTVARLVSRRIAAIAALVLGTSPMWFFVARQAITDIPMAATAAGTGCALLLAIYDGDRRIGARPWLVFAGALALLVVPQVALMSLSLYRGAPLGPGMNVRFPHLVLLAPAAVAALALVGLSIWPRRVTSARDLYAYVAYVLAGVSILGKGPPGVAVIALTVFSIVVFTGRFALLWQLRIVQGVLIVLLVAGPWHLAMALRDGTPFVSEYFGQHWLGRAAGEVHQANLPGTETFRYYLEELAMGLGPWLVLVPGAFAWAADRAGHVTARDRVGFAGLAWSVVGIAFFTVVGTKFHHYVLPVLPGIAIVVALYADAILSGRARVLGAIAWASGGAVLLVAASVASSPDQIIEMFTYRYDRPWPIEHDLTKPIAIGAMVCALAAIALSWSRTRPIALVSLGVLACVIALAGAPAYMALAAPHWGQRDLIRSYYTERGLHGVTLRYEGSRALHDEIAPFVRGDAPLWIPMAPPRALPRGTIPLSIEHRGERVVLDATIARSGRIERGEAPGLELRFSAGAPPGLERLLELGRAGERYPGDGPEVVVDADRLIALSLYWRGETFWTGDEINGPVPEMQSELRGGASELRTYLERFGGRGRTFFVVTEATGTSNVRAALPSEHARDSFRVVDGRSNKFVLLAFETAP
jgi:4-amino-4-deoxy-L-arabinose transferase-like glycosyltransferase